jgi:hypothetical protein
VWTKNKEIKRITRTEAASSFDGGGGGGGSAESVLTG